MASFASGSFVRASALCLGVCALLGGCSLFSKPQGEAPPLLSAKMSPDTVVLEITTVAAPADILQFENDIWLHVDEQHLPGALRVRLAANGLRCGLLGSHHPQSMARLFDSPPAVGSRGNPSLVGELGQSEIPIDAPVKHHRQRMQIRAGNRGTIMLGGSHKDLAVLLNNDGHVGGRTFEDARCILSVRAFPLGNGTVRLEVSPEIEHGETKTQYVGRQGRIDIRVGRNREIYDQLICIAALSPGQTLLFSTTRQPHGLGQHFFTQETDGGPRRSFCMIRLVQTQYDDLFAEERISTPIATSME